MITEDYVSFEVAKLLKEKGFDEYCTHVYNIGTGRNLEADFYTSRYVYNSWLDKNEPRLIAVPTLQMTMKWLREVHSLYIDIVTSFSQDGICYTFSCSNVMDLIQGTKGTSYNEYQTYEETCEAAIKYCLEKLI